ncbi:hypothetical protein EDB89DRAFT_1968498 [Lactarius sanguifluus]|nr:hypothetical protein EDB89DRAFT_1968498 [Lactarius sanguifluus]
MHEMPTLLVTNPVEFFFFFFLCSTLNRCRTITHAASCTHLPCTGGSPPWYHTCLAKVKLFSFFFFFFSNIVVPTRLPATPARLPHQHCRYHPLTLRGILDKCLFLPLYPFTTNCCRIWRNIATTSACPPYYDAAIPIPLPPPPPQLPHSQPAMHQPRRGTTQRSAEDPTSL